MIELIPANEMKNYLQEINHEFNDWEKATMIFHAFNATFSEKMQSFKELFDLTMDKVLKKQLAERMHYENEIMRLFQINDDSRYVYVVVEYEDYEEDICGYFDQYNVALQYAISNEHSIKEQPFMKQERCFGIKKQEIIEEQIPMAKSWGRWKMNLCPEAEDLNKELIKYSGEAVATTHFNNKGEIIDILSYEMSEEEEQKIDTFHKDRFEYQFVNIPFYHKLGMLVKDIRDEMIYIVRTAEQGWEQLINRIEAGLLEVQYFDMAITVYCLTEEGILSHEHINPIFLEPAFLKADDDTRSVFEACSDYLVGIGKGETLLNECRAYANKKYLEARNKSQLYRAETVEDILW